MKWEELCNCDGQAALHGPPNALIVQLGENNLLLRKGIDLNKNIKEDFDRLLDLTLIWSQLLERRCWQDCPYPVAINRARKIASHAIL